MADFKGIEEQYDDINQVGSRPVGLMTEFTTEAGRPIYISHNGEIVSEKSTTIPYNGKYVNVPSIHDGIEYSEFELIKLLDEKKIKPTSTHKTQELAVKAAQKRSPSLMSEETARAVESKYWKEMTKRKATADQILGDSSTELVTPDAKAERRMDDLQAIQEDQFLDLYGEGEKSQKLDAYMSTLSEDDKSDMQSYLDNPTPKINSIEGDEAMAKGRARRNDVDETVLAFSNGGDTTTNLGNMEINKSSDGKTVQITSGNMSKEEAEKIKREAEARKGMTQEDKKTASFADLDKNTKSTEEDKAAKSKATVEKIKTKLRSGEITLDEAKELYMKLSEVGGFADGGLLDEGGSVDPVSGNDVPVGSTQEEVRDDIPAQLSEGEFVLPADVVRYIGLENLMELRSKAKEGLAKMEAMGQMGNSEEAVMDSDGEYESEIDDLIDNFDPNDPETLSFADGGVVHAYDGANITSSTQQNYAYVPPSNITSPNINVQPYPLAVQSPQYSAGYFPQSVYTPPALQPTGQQKIYSPGVGVGGGVSELRQYQGPNGEMISILFLNGVPQQEIPKGYTRFKPDEVKAPEIATPTVQQPTSDGGDGGDNAARAQQEQQQKEQYEGWVTTMNQLSELDPEFSKEWSKSPQNPKNKSEGFLGGLSDFVKMGGVVGMAKNAYDLNMSAQNAYQKVANQYGLDIGKYENSFSFFGLDKYNESSLVNDAVATKTAIDSIASGLKGAISKKTGKPFTEEELRSQVLGNIARSDIKLDANMDGVISDAEKKAVESQLFFGEEDLQMSLEDARTQRQKEQAMADLFETDDGEFIDIDKELAQMDREKAFASVSGPQEGYDDSEPLSIGRTGTNAAGDAYETSTYADTSGRQTEVTTTTSSKTGRSSSFIDSDGDGVKDNNEKGVVTSSSGSPVRSGSGSVVTSRSANDIGAGSSSSADCFMPGTMVTMADGSKKTIEKIVEGDEVLGISGNVNKVLGVENHKIINENGYNVLSHVEKLLPFYTANHPFYHENELISFMSHKNKEHNPWLGKVEKAGKYFPYANTMIAPKGTILYNLYLEGDYTFFANDVPFHNIVTNGFITMSLFNTGKITQHDLESDVAYTKTIKNRLVRLGYATIAIPLADEVRKGSFLGKCVSTICAPFVKGISALSNDKPAPFVKLLGYTIVYPLFMMIGALEETKGKYS